VWERRGERKEKYWSGGQVKKKKVTGGGEREWPLLQAEKTEQ
jgi:hypothetical protein